MSREELFDKHLRGELSPAEAAELKQLLAVDAAAGRAFVEHVGETALFIRVGSQLESSAMAGNVVPLASASREGEGSNTWSRRWRIAALAACLLGAAALAVFVNRPPRQPGSPTIASEAPAAARTVYVTGPGVQILRAGKPVDAGSSELQAGDVIIASTNETASIVYSREATRIDLQPGTVAVFGDIAEGKRLELQKGIVHARVAPQPTGQQFRIITSQARATVLGTEFLLRADEQATRLDVLEGKVRFNCRISGKKVVVKAGFGATVQSAKASFDVTPLCSSNCILRECRGSDAALKYQKLKANDEK